MPRRLSENSDPARRVTCCPECSVKCEQELAILVDKEVEKLSDEVKSEASKPNLPQWLQNATVKTTDQSQIKDQELVVKRKTEELQKKWNDTCLRLHPRPERVVPSAMPMTGMYKPNPNLLIPQLTQPKLSPPKNLHPTLQLNTNQVVGQRASSPPGSPVRTDLVLGPTKVADESPVKDLLSCISSQPEFNLRKANLLMQLMPTHSGNRIAT